MVQLLCINEALKLRRQILTFSNELQPVTLFWEDGVKTQMLAVMIQIFH